MTEQHLPIRVFLVEDSPIIRERLTESISAEGRIEVIGYADSESAAVAALRSAAFDAMVLDLQLKEGSGTNVIKAVRAERELAGVRILVTSNHTSPQLRAGCLELGADRYFDKVKELPALAACLSEMAVQ